MDPRPGLDALKVQKIICPCRKSNNVSTVVHPVTQSHLRGKAKGNHVKFYRPKRLEDQRHRNIGHKICKTRNEFKKITA